MQTSIFVTLSVLFAGVLSSTANGVITPESASEIPGNSPNGPGSTNINDKYPGEIAKWSYPKWNTLKSWPAQPKGSKRDECSLDVQVVVGSCSSGAYGYKPQVIPYDRPSTTAIEGKVSFNVKHEGGDYYE
jgi:hypothetical protein